MMMAEIFKFFIDRIMQGIGGHIPVCEPNCSFIPFL